MFKKRKFIGVLLIALVISLGSCKKVNTNPIPTVTYTITYHLDGGINHSDNPLTFTNKSAPITLIVASKQGYLFDGWFKDEGFVTSIIIIPTGTTGNLNLYAKWTSTTASQSTITFNTNGGSTVNSVTQNVGTSLTTPTNPTKTDYNFVGWYTDDTTFLNQYTFSTMPTSNLTLYAKWSPVGVGEGYVCNTFGTSGVCPTINLSYYSTVSGLYGIDLKNALHEVIDDGLANIGTYTATTDKLKIADEDVSNSNNIYEHYSRVSVPKTNYRGSYLGSDYWNKEHVWAKSHGDFENLKAGADIMNLRPSFGSTNSARGNSDYNNLGSNPSIKTVLYNSQTITTGYNNTDGSFTPTDQAKGDIARILMYMVVMYNGDTASQGLDLELNDSIVTISTYKGAFHGKISVIMQWHLQDPVDAMEIRRNNLVYGIQGNRNPFVDYPHFAELLWPTYYA